MPGVTEDGGVRLAGGALVPAPVPDDCAAGAEVQLSVRPEKIWLGSGTRVVALEQNTHVSDASDRWEIGDPVTLAWRPEHSRVLR